MKLIWHLVKKDLRLLWPWLALWYVALVLLIYKDFWLQTKSSDHFFVIHHDSFIYISFLLGLSTLAYASPLILVASLVDADPPLDDRAFWRTLPLGGARLFAAKILFLFIFAVLVPALIAAPGKWFPGVHPDQRLSLLGSWAAFLAAAVILLFLAASLFRKPLVGFAMLGGLPFFLSVALPFLASGYLLFYLFTIFTWASATVALLACLATVACIYIQHRRRLALKVLLLGLALAVTVGCLWPDDPLFAPEPAPRLHVPR